MLGLVADREGDLRGTRWVTELARPVGLCAAGQPRPVSFKKQETTRPSG
jgi:hypothetical protein